MNAPLSTNAYMEAEDPHNLSENSGKLEKAVSHKLLGIAKYVPNAIWSRVIIKRSTGNVTISALDAGEGFVESISGFDSFIQIIDGTAEIFINEKKYIVKLGEGIIIPGHLKQCIQAKERFKMISTTIKSDYDF